MPSQGKYPDELRERAVRMVLDHEDEYGSQWEAICSVAEKLGPKAETVRLWVRRAEADEGRDAAAAVCRRGVVGRGDGGSVGGGGADGAQLAGGWGSTSTAESGHVALGHQRRRDRPALHQEGAHRGGDRPAVGLQRQPGLRAACPPGRRSSPAGPSQSPRSDRRGAQPPLRGLWVEPAWPGGALRGEYRGGARMVGRGVHRSASWWSLSCRL